MIPCTETSLSYSEIMSIALKVILNSPTFEQAKVPLNETGKNFVMPTPKGSFGSVTYYDLDYASKIIHAFIYNDISFDDFIKQNPIEKKDWYRDAVGDYELAGTSSNTSSDTSSNSSSDTSSNTSSDTSSNTSSNTSSDTSSGDTSSGDTSSGNTSSGPDGTSSEDSSLEE